ncbi:hypothetical protein HDU86_004172 [Geranomyces michiganensis]|nr:hypothetical protein HDU86_004172 [Geranomyces michiganensis]
MTFGGISIMMLTAIAYERYALIVRGEPLPNTILVAIIGSTWAALIMWGTSYWWFKPLYGYPMRSSGFMCLVNWADPSPNGKAATWASCSIIFAGLAIIFFSYYNILREIRNVNRVIAGVMRENIDITAVREDIDAWTTELVRQAG